MPVLEVVEDLKPDSHMPGERGNHLFVLLHRTGHPQTGIQGRLESGRGFQCINLQGVQWGDVQVSGFVPGHLRPLPVTEFDVRSGHFFENVG